MMTPTDLTKGKIFVGKKVFAAMVKQYGGNDFKGQVIHYGDVTFVAAKHLGDSQMVTFDPELCEILKELKKQQDSGS